MNRLTAMYKDQFFLNGHVADPQLAVSLTAPSTAHATPRTGSTVGNTPVSTPWSTAMNFFKSLMYLGGLESADLRLEDDASPFRPTYGNRVASEAVFGKRAAQPAARERRASTDRRATPASALPAGCR